MLLLLYCYYIDENADVLKVPQKSVNAKNSAEVDSDSDSNNDSEDDSNDNESSDESAGESEDTEGQGAGEWKWSLNLISDCNSTMKSEF